MNQQTLLGILTAFTLAQRQILLTLELLMNDNRCITYTPSDTRHRIRQLAYFRMIHESDFVLPKHANGQANICTSMSFTSDCIWSFVHRYCRR
uniref:Secreted protein n=2 Tax=Cucumis melo TaxID=3656 RepID=A0A9I9ED80_CUCME